MKFQKGNADMLVVIVCACCVPFVLSDWLFKTDFAEPCHVNRCLKSEVMEYHNKRGTEPSESTRNQWQE